MKRLGFTLSGIGLILAVVLTLALRVTTLAHPAPPNRVQHYHVSSRGDNPDGTGCLSPSPTTDLTTLTKTQRAAYGLDMASPEMLRKLQRDGVRQANGAVRFAPLTRVCQGFGVLPDGTQHFNPTGDVPFTASAQSDIHANFQSQASQGHAGSLLLQNEGVTIVSAQVGFSFLPQCLPGAGAPFGQGDWRAVTLGGHGSYELTAGESVRHNGPNNNAYYLSIMDVGSDTMPVDVINTGCITPNSGNQSCGVAFAVSSLPHSSLGYMTVMDFCTGQYARWYNHSVNNSPSTNAPGIIAWYGDPDVPTTEISYFGNVLVQYANGSQINHFVLVNGGYNFTTWPVTDEYLWGSGYAQDGSQLPPYHEQVENGPYDPSPNGVNGTGYYNVWIASPCQC